MTGWSALDRELDRWQAARRRASFWWRDDDATDASATLARLLALAGRHGLPIGLAVVPAGATAELAAAVAGRPRVAVLQHGFAHRNHAPEDEKKCELGAHRPAAAVIAELRQGRRLLQRLFGRRLRPVLVPPWNRIDAGVVRRLPAQGFAGLSTFQPRPAPEAAAGLRQVNCHIEIMDWRARRFIGQPAALDFAVGHLAARREGRADAREPTGLMTHHLAHDEAAWRFLERFLAATARHSAARWLSPAQVFARR